MPRDIVLGNGELLVNLDRHLFIRDLYYPYVGWANHVGGHRCRIGVWAEGGAFAWLDDPAWEWQIKYETDTLVTDCSAHHPGLGLRLKASQAVLHDVNVFVQRFRLESTRGEAREVRVFFAHDLRIDESDIGDTAFYDPYANAMVHYKRDRYFLFGGQVGEGAPEDGAGLTQYACGEKGFRGAEGTWRDAEDGRLSQNAIAQGAVDSVVGYSLTVPGRGEAVLRTWMAAGETREEVLQMQEALRRRGFEEALAETGGHGGTYALRRTDLDSLPPRVAELFTRSLLIIRTQVDKRGAILASNDTDIMETARAHYSYLWPRDGALVSFALDRVGLSELTRPFFEFCARVLPKDRAALMHKYGPTAPSGRPGTRGTSKARGRKSRSRRTALPWSSGPFGSTSRSMGIGTLPSRSTASSSSPQGSSWPPIGIGRRACRWPRGTSGRSGAARTSSPRRPSPPRSKPPPNWQRS